MGAGVCLVALISARGGGPPSAPGLGSPWRQGAGSHPLPDHWLQGEAGGCVLNFGPRGSSVVTIPRERLRAGVEYTFNLTVWKAGRREEATSQTVGTAQAVPQVLGGGAACT